MDSEGGTRGRACGDCASAKRKCLGGRPCKRCIASTGSYEEAVAKCVELPDRRTRSFVAIRVKNADGTRSAPRTAADGAHAHTTTGKRTQRTTTYDSSDEEAQAPPAPKRAARESYPSSHAAAAAPSAPAAPAPGRAARVHGGFAASGASAPGYNPFRSGPALAAPFGMLGAPAGAGGHRSAPAPGLPVVAGPSAPRSGLAAARTGSVDLQSLLFMDAVLTADQAAALERLAEETATAAAAGGARLPVAPAAPAAPAVPSSAAAIAEASARAAMEHAPVPCLRVSYDVDSGAVAACAGNAAWRALFGLAQEALDAACASGAGAPRCIHADDAQRYNECSYQTLRCRRATQEMAARFVAHGRPASEPSVFSAREISHLEYDTTGAVKTITMYYTDVVMQQQQQQGPAQAQGEPAARIRRNPRGGITLAAEPMPLPRMAAAATAAAAAATSGASRAGSPSAVFGSAAFWTHAAPSTATSSSSATNARGLSFAGLQMAMAGGSSRAESPLGAMAAAAVAASGVGGADPLFFTFDDLSPVATNGAAPAAHAASARVVRSRSLSPVAPASPAAATAPLLLLQQQALPSLGLSSTAPALLSSLPPMALPDHIMLHHHTHNPLTIHRPLAGTATGDLTPSLAGSTPAPVAATGVFAAPWNRRATGTGASPSATLSKGTGKSVDADDGMLLWKEGSDAFVAFDAGSRSGAGSSSSSIFGAIAPPPVAPPASAFLVLPPVKPLASSPASASSITTTITTTTAAAAATTTTGAFVSSPAASAAASASTVRPVGITARLYPSLDRRAPWMTLAAFPSVQQLKESNPFARNAAPATAAAVAATGVAPADGAGTATLLPARPRMTNTAFAACVGQGVDDLLDASSSLSKSQEVGFGASLPAPRGPTLVPALADTSDLAFPDFQW